MAGQLWWLLVQYAIIVGVAGWLIASGETSNGLAAGFVAYMVAKGFTIGVTKAVDLWVRLRAQGIRQVWLDRAKKQSSPSKLIADPSRRLP